jgi:hypothetical protein
MELSFDTWNGFCINSCVWKQWSFATSFIGFLWQYMTIVYIKCASSISNVHRGIASGSQCTSQHQNVNHRLFNIVSQTMKRIACKGNIEKTQFEYKNYSHSRPKEPINVCKFQGVHQSCWIPNIRRLQWICEQVVNKTTRFHINTWFWPH